MKFVLASDSFKGSLSSNKANEIIKQAAIKVYGDCHCDCLMIADGGEGTLEAVMGESGNGYEKITIQVTGPLGHATEAYYIKKGEQAVVEMAQASGLPLVSPQLRNPLKTSTRGTGELIAHALNAGCRDIYIGIGGSATNDGGTGAMEALGYKFLDGNGNTVKGNGENLVNIVKIDDSEAMTEIREARFTVMCDVTNPLTGKQGATYIYGPQKGATEEILVSLEEGMINYQNVLEQYLGREISTIPGLGAAGGLGAALYTFLNAQMKSGIDVLLDLNGFDKLIEDADVVVTGEGKTDNQSACGKVIFGIAKRCKAQNKPVYVTSGCITEGAKDLYKIGVTDMEAADVLAANLEDAMTNAEEYLYKAAIRIFERNRRKG